MKKVFGFINLKSAVAIVVLGAAVLGGTIAATNAYFSDTETSSANSIATGTLDLDWNGNDDQGEYVFSLTNQAPGATSTAFKLIKNSGSLSGELDIDAGTITNTESTGATEYESDAVGGAGVGELGGVAEIAPWIDLDKDGVFDAGADIALKNDGTTVTTALQYGTVNSFDGDSWDAAKVMAAADEYRFYIAWQIPFGGSAVNNIQGDSLSFTITFTLEQAEVD